MSPEIRRLVTLVVLGAILALVAYHVRTRASDRIASDVRSACVEWIESEGASGEPC